MNPIDKSNMTIEGENVLIDGEVAGIITSDTGGLQADKRTYWSDPDTGHLADLAVEAQIHPANWGTLILQAP